MSSWKISIAALLILIFAVFCPAQDIGVRGGSSGSKPEPKRPTKPAPRRTPPVVRPKPAKPKQRVKLTIVTDPAECEVYLDDAYQGTTALSTGRLVIPELDAEAKHNLRVYKRDVGEENMTLDLDEDREVIISLKKAAASSSEPTASPKPEDAASNKPVEKQPEKPPEKPPTQSSADKPLTDKSSVEKQPESAEPPKTAQAAPAENRPEPKPEENSALPEVKDPPKPPLKEPAVEPAASSENKPEPSPNEPKKIVPAQSPMVLIPAGEFVMGSNKGPIDNEKPQRKIYLPAFYIDVYEVTNAEFKLYCDATGHSYPENPPWDSNYFLGRPNNPVINVTWHDANAYAQWVGKRLPAEEEWEKAARGSEGRLWPWGKEYNLSMANLDGREDGYEFTSPIGTFRNGASAYGVQDIIGNVWEWTASIFKPYPDSPDKDNRYQKEHRVIRGGAYQSPSNILRSAAFRFPSEPNQAYEATGFRCAKSQ